MALPLPGEPNWLCRDPMRLFGALLGACLADAAIEKLQVSGGK
jgi:hypothetical protein